MDHYIVAYNDTLGNARIADLDIHNTTPFINTANVATLAVSDMVQLTGVNVTTLSSGNIQFAA